MLTMMLAAAAMSAPDLPTRLEKAQLAATQCEGAIAISVISPEGRAHFTNGGVLDVARPVRIASVTKTATAATILRLAEMERLSIDDPIAAHLSPALVTILRDDGYDPDAITIRQVLSHSAGLYSHAEDPRYGPRIFADPEHRWSRQEQIELMAEWGDPLGPPGRAFSYSDSGYVMLGDIIEHHSGKPVGVAVREILEFDRLGLRESWWEISEDAPPGGPERGRQFVGGNDATSVDGSADAYGGGGLVMSMRDLATMFRAINSGSLFDEARSLATMRWQGPHENGATYRLGIFATAMPDGTTLWSHSGFWGTLAMHHDETGVTLAGVTNEQSDFPCLMRTMMAMTGLTG